MPPKIQQPQKIVYPLGVKDISDDLGVDELVRRLKTCAQSFQSMNQDDDNKNYVILAIHLAQEAFLEHSSKDVRLLIACCIADVFRVYAPDAPYKDPEHLKAIFIFLIHQLRGLEDPKDPAFKRYFYLLENLAWVKSFNICIELDDNQEIFCQLFKLLFKIVNDDHSTKVKNFMLDMMCPLISEADSVSQELLDVILSNIIEPRKTQNKNAYNLAKDLLKRTAPTIEPYIQAFFNNSLILGKAPDTDIGKHLYDLIYELNSISPSVLLAVLPQLEFKLKSNDEKERLDVTRLLARMFSDKDSELAVQHQSLWNCFLGRFNDISVAVRTRCVQYSMHFLLNHPELTKDITEQLKLRQHDPEETVRYEVVMAIVSAAKKDFSSVSEELLTFVKERTLDKKFKIRKEALLGLSVIYKQCMTTGGLSKQTVDCVSWIKNKVLHVYYQTALEDRLLVERILHTCLVPYQLDTEDRMKKLLQLYSTVDDHAVKAFNELLKCQNIVRSHVRSLLELIGDESNEEKEKNMTQKIAVLASVLCIKKSLPEPVKTQEFIKKFVTTLQMDKRLMSQMEVIMKHDCSCKEAEESVREILKKLGNPVMTNVFYMTVKKMLERVAPVMIDRAAIEVLIDLVSKMLSDIREDDLETCKPERGLKLLYTLSWVFPGAFQCRDIYSRFLQFLQLGDELAAEMTLQIFANIGSKLEFDQPETSVILVPILKRFASEGSMKQAKYAVRCLVTICRDRYMIFEHSLEELKKHLTLESTYFCTALVSVGHIAYYCPDLFGSQMKNIVSKVVVKDLLMQDRDNQRSDGDGWCSEDELSDETKAKIEGMKLMVRWLLGLKTSTNSAISSLKLLTTVILHDGDLMEKGKIAIAEKSWLRYMAGCCILKLCQEPTYSDILTPEQFNTVARLLNDECKDVRDRFSQKLHKGLISLKLPLDFMAIFALAGNESTKDLRTQLTHNLQANVNKRRDYLKQHSVTNDKIFQFLPDYVLPYAIHLLAHDPVYKKYDNVKTLQSIKECLWFLMEPLMMNNENYSFGFFKKLLENIKQTKDAQNPADEMQNMKLYAVCDLALSIVLSKTTNFVLVEHPVEPKLPSKLFTDVDRTHANTKTYLPAELTVNPPKVLNKLTYTVLTPTRLMQTFL
uniref:Uncharacterized protein n=1 Tax=Strigamia maritima TaxID=126957 RepID=T1J3Z9_STRMM